MAKQSAKGRKKKWYEIVAPELFKGVSLGESYVYDASSLLNKKLKVNLNSLNFDKKQNINVMFKVSKVDGGRAHTEIIGYEVYGAYLKRLIRAGSRKVEDSSLYETKDNVRLRIKFFLVTRGKPSNAVLSSLRKETQKSLKDYLKTKSYREFLGDVLYTKIHRLIKDKLKKIHPVVALEFSKIIRV